jgi:glycosyltransferase involved in cell wall biosynthesis
VKTQPFSVDARDGSGHFTICQIGAFHEGTGRTPTNADTLKSTLAGVGISSICSSYQTRRWARGLDMLRTLLRSRRSIRLGIVHVYSGPAFLWALMSVSVLKAFGKPVVIWLHGGNLPAYSKQHPRLVDFAFAKADKILAPSEYLAGAFSSSHRIEQMPYELPLGSYPYQHRASIRPRLLWLRAFNEGYNPEMAIRVLADLKATGLDARLTMCGPDNGDGSFQRTRRLAAELDVEDAVDFPGKVSKDRIRKLGIENDIFLNTTNYDNTPVSVIEAMAMGMCVVSTEVGGIPLLVRDRENGILVPKNDDSAMADACRELLDHPTAVGGISRQGRDTALQYDEEKLAIRWAALLRGLTAQVDLHETGS